MGTRRGARNAAVRHGSGSNRHLPRAAGIAVETLGPVLGGGRVFFLQG